MYGNAAASLGDRIVFHAPVGIRLFADASRMTLIGSRPWVELLSTYLENWKAADIGCDPL